MLKSEFILSSKIEESSKLKFNGTNESSNSNNISRLIKLVTSSRQIHVKSELNLLLFHRIYTVGQFTETKKSMN